MIIFVCLLITLSNATICSSYTSASALFAASSLSTFSPSPTDCGIYTCETYVWGIKYFKYQVAHQTCLGWFGPVSAYGPLSALGYNSIFSGSSSYMGNSVNLIDQVVDGPLSDVGPLGDTPFFTTMGNINDFTEHMQGLGVWSVLGPIGPLGPLGPMGPLGTASGYSQNSSGDFLDGQGQIINTVNVQWNSTHTQTWPLFESYTQSRADQLSGLNQLDTSFAVFGAYNSQSFTVHSEANQFVTILVVPVLQGGQFDICAKAPGDVNCVAESDSYYFSNWIQMDVDTEQDIVIEVSGFGYYNFFVVGSTSFMNRQAHISYSGDYIQNC